MLTRTLLLLMAPMALTVSAQVPFDTLRMLHRAEIFFSFGRADLSPEARQTLQEVALHWQRAGEGAVVRIVGHTDSIGSPSSNLRLSERRAQAAAAALKEYGIGDSALEMTFHGESVPAADNSSEEGRRRNRRVELSVLMRVPMSTLSGRVTDQKTGKPIAATVYIAVSQWRDSLHTDKDGGFRWLLPKDSIAQLEVFAPGYFFQTTDQRVGEQSALQIALPPTISGEKIALRNLLFYGNEAILLPHSESELPRVLRFMQINPEVRIEIAGHINNPLKSPTQLDQWEWDLSVNRAKVVYDYLLKNGIPPERMRYKGYGNTEMLYPSPKSTEEQQAKNRRVEIRIQ